MAEHARASTSRRSTSGRSFLRMWRWKLHWQILLGLVIGALAGWVIGAHAVGRIPADALNRSEQAVAIAKSTPAFLLASLIGDLFLNGLKLIIVPLVTSSIILATAKLGSGSAFGRLGGKTLIYYATTSLIAILIGLSLVDLVRPGRGADGTGILVHRDMTAFAQAQAAVEQKVGGRGASDFLNVFRQMVPGNVFRAAAEGDLLGLIVVSLFVGFFLSRMKGEPSRILMHFTQGVYDVTMKITDVVLCLAPIGVIGLLAATIGEQYAQLKPHDELMKLINGVGAFAVVVLCGLLLHVLVTMPLILWLVARVNPWRHYRAMLPALMTAFSTASSSATLPITMECVEERAGVSNQTASFVLPLGATVNMDGTALYECIAAMFICQAFGLDLTFGQQFMIVVAALLTSIGVAGVPAASLVAIVIILNAVEAGLPAGTLPPGVSLIAGLGLLFIFDRPLDMCRTAVNIFSDSVGAVVVARSEGERNVLTRAEIPEPIELAEGVDAKRK